ncbi:MAG: pilus assembly protein [Candidatus Solibacter usitatus]|nr:pilus assembly protein [Candidatus Solibacter usitatus]
MHETRNIASRAAPGTGLRRRVSGGQAALEFLISYSLLLLPVTMMLIFTSQMLWIWHGVNDWTREGARYAATHCWQGDGGNVSTYMKLNAPLMTDRDQFTQGPAEIQITYFSKDPDSGDIVEFACTDGECSQACIPELVRVRVAGYQFRTFLTYLGLNPITIPDFQTTVPMESAGCNPDSTDCLP